MVNLGTVNPLLVDRGVPVHKAYHLFHSWDGKHSLEYEWLRNRAAFDDWQSLQSEERFDVKRRPWIVTWSRPSPNRGLLLGVYEITGPPAPVEGKVRDKLTGKCYEGLFRYPMEPRDLVKDISRCVIVGGVPRRWWLRANKNDKRILELLDQPDDPPFPNILKFNVNVDELPNLPRPWRDEVVRERGVYVLYVDDLWYVGKADGEGGFWERWEEYRLTRHGGNKRVKAYTDAHPHANISVEAVWRMEAYSTTADVLEMEAIWKEKMERFTGRKGLNGN